MKDKRVYYTIILGLCYLLFFALGIKLFREPDLWWQLRTGEWILQNMEVPHTDDFSYTAAGVPWINIKWGFEVLAALFAKMVGVENLYLLQAIVNVVILFFMLKISKLFNSFDSWIAVAFTTSLAVIMVGLSAEYRMIGRPEMFSHLFTLVYIFLLEQWRRNTASQIIFLLIPLQCLWANTHEAFAIGIVIIVIYTAGMMLQKKMFSPSITNNNILKLATVLLLSIVSITINPNGVKLLASPFEIFSQVQQNKYTTELSGLSEQAVIAREVYLVAFAVLFLVGSIALQLIRKPNKTKQNPVVQFGIPYLLLLGAFMYLGYSAYRNLVFLSFILFPVWIYFFTLVYTAILKYGQKWQKPLYYVSAGAAVIFYIAVVSNRYYTFTGSRDNFGLGIPCNMHPQGVAAYIEKKQLQDKKCFSDYLTSSYLMWHLQPKFKTYIDLRDLDVYTTAFFNDYLHIINDYRYFLKADSINHFDYVVLQRTTSEMLHAFLYNDSIYACTYVDQVAAVYEKTDDFSRNDIFSYCNTVKQNSLSQIINHILNPFYSGINFSGTEANLLAAQYYTTTGRLDLAVQRIQQAFINPGLELDKVHNANGNLYMKRAIFETQLEKKNEYYTAAAVEYDAALLSNDKNTEARLGLGSAKFYLLNYADALQVFEEIIARDGKEPTALDNAIECCRALAKVFPHQKEEMVKRELKYCKMAYDINRQHPVAIMNLGLAYYKAGNKKESQRMLLQVEHNPLLSEAQRNIIREVLGK